nr:basic proline-rich protein-like [Aegilops tauschii subsp. strangulata]
MLPYALSPLLCFACVCAQPLRFASGPLRPHIQGPLLRPWPGRLCCCAALLQRSPSHAPPPLPGLSTSASNLAPQRSNLVPEPYPPTAQAPSPSGSGRPDGRAAPPRTGLPRAQGSGWPRRARLTSRGRNARPAGRRLAEHGARPVGLRLPAPAATSAPPPPPGLPGPPPASRPRPPAPSALPASGSPAPPPAPAPAPGPRPVVLTACRLRGGRLLVPVQLPQHLPARRLCPRGRVQLPPRRAGSGCPCALASPPGRLASPLAGFDRAARRLRPPAHPRASVRPARAAARPSRPASPQPPCGLAPTTPRRLRPCPGLPCRLPGRDALAGRPAPPWPAPAALADSLLQPTSTRAAGLPLQPASACPSTSRRLAPSQGWPPKKRKKK